MYPKAMNLLEEVGKITIVTILSVSCSVMTPSSTVYYQENADAPKERWPVVRDDYSSFSISIQPFEKIDEALVFGVDLTNHGTQPFFVDPNSWRLHTTDLNQQSVTEQPLNEQEISAAFSNEAAALTKRENNRQVAIAVVAVVLIVGVVVLLANANSDAGDESDESVDFEGDQFIDNSISVGLSFYNHGHYDRERPASAEETIGYYQREAERFSNLTIEPTWLEPGESISFDLFFDRSNIVDRFELTWEVGDEPLSYPFSHQLYR
jgi:hypothetical protein